MTILFLHSIFTSNCPSFLASSLLCFHHSLDERLPLPISRFCIPPCMRSPCTYLRQETPMTIATICKWTRRSCFRVESRQLTVFHLLYSHSACLDYKMGIDSYSSSHPLSVGLSSPQQNVASESMSSNNANTQASAKRSRPRRRKPKKAQNSNNSGTVRPTGSSSAQVRIFSFQSSTLPMPA